MRDSEAPAARILVVDDNTMNRELARAHLTGEGYVVSMAACGDEAIARFTDWRPDLVLLDVLMPGMDGFTTCRALRALPGGAEVTIAFLTALGGLADQRQALEAGGDDFLSKPLNRVELLIRVRSLLRIKRNQDAVRSSHETIRAQRDELLQAQRLREELMAFLVNDLKNPLTAVLGNADYLSEETGLSDEARSAARDVFAAAQEMHRMVLNLLDVNRAGKEGLVVHVAEVDLAGAIEGVCAAARRRALESGLRLDTEVGHVPPLIRTDPDLLRRVLQNLLDNSFKYTPTGGCIRVEARRATDGVEVRVRDDGPGIPRDFRERIFHPYARLERDAGERTSRGLGLAFCRLAVETLGGRIWVEDNLPHGSAFHVRLPG